MMAILIFAGFVVFLFGLSWYLGQRAKSADNFFVAGGQIHWFINGVALTGGYLSAASFLGICGMIAFRGFDGFLYSMGFLSGWVVALFVVAEPLRRLGKYTFADALGARFKSPNIHLAASISTLIISLCYLVPQMVGAGVLIEPLLGIAHHWGVIIVGLVVIVVVASAGMSSTTYVQFIKASMLITFSAILVGAILVRGLDTTPKTYNLQGIEVPPYTFRTLTPADDSPAALRAVGFAPVDRVEVKNAVTGAVNRTWILLEEWETLQPMTYIMNRQSRSIPILQDTDGALGARFQLTPLREPDAVQPHGGEFQVGGSRYRMREGSLETAVRTWWKLDHDTEGRMTLHEAQSVRFTPEGTWVNGLPPEAEGSLLTMGRMVEFGKRTGHDGERGALSPMRYMAIFSDPGTVVEVPRRDTITHAGHVVNLYYPKTVTGDALMRPGGHFDLGEGAFWSRLDFISLMLALFFGTAALPHVLIRYYTVKDGRAARKSTIVAITAIGLFYILTLFLGIGAIANGVLNPLNDNMSAPLLARSFGEMLFAAVTALAFATVLGTVAGLIVAASGAVANDFLDRYMKLDLSGNAKVIAAKSTAVVVGVVSVVLGILFKDVNVGFLVGWAFAVAASANFPAIIMVLFWKRTTAAGVVSAILVGMSAALAIILLGPDMFVRYGMERVDAWIPLGQPAILSMPLSFLVLIGVSLLTQPKGDGTDSTASGSEPVPASEGTGTPA